MRSTQSNAVSESCAQAGEGSRQGWGQAATARAGRRPAGRARAAAARVRAAAGLTAHLAGVDCNHDSAGLLLAVRGGGGPCAARTLGLEGGSRLQAPRGGPPLLLLPGRCCLNGCVPREGRRDASHLLRACTARQRSSAHKRGHLDDRRTIEQFWASRGAPLASHVQLRRATASGHDRAHLPLRATYSNLFNQFTVWVPAYMLCAALRAAAVQPCLCECEALPSAARRAPSARAVPHPSGHQSRRGRRPPIYTGGGYLAASCRTRFLYSSRRCRQAWGSSRAVRRCLEVEAQGRRNVQRKEKEGGREPSRLPAGTSRRRRTARATAGWGCPAAPVSKEGWANGRVGSFSADLQLKPPPIHVRSAAARRRPTLAPHGSAVRAHPPSSARAARTHPTWIPSMICLTVMEGRQPSSSFKMLRHTVPLG